MQPSHMRYACIQVDFVTVMLKSHRSDFAAATTCMLLCIACTSALALSPIPCAESTLAKFRMQLAGVVQGLSSPHRLCVFQPVTADVAAACFTTRCTSYQLQPTADRPKKVKDFVEPYREVSDAPCTACTQ
jgi:hypothetical protein